MSKRYKPQTTIFPHKGNSFVVKGQPIDVVVQHHNPLVLVLDNVLTPNECEKVIAAAKINLEPAQVVVDNEGQTRAGSRSNQSAGLHDLDPRMAMIKRRLHVLCGMPSKFGEILQVQHYLPGQKYVSHNDEYPSVAPATHNARVATLIVYLNEVEEGGVTGFTHMRLQVVPKPGRAVYFEYGADYYHRALALGRQPDEYTDLDPRLEHFGAAVKQGEKWIMTQWFFVPTDLDQEPNNEPTANR